MAAGLLLLLDPDPHKAEEKYRELYRRLVRFFEWNRVGDPEGLAQESLARAFQRLRDGQFVTCPDPASYFFGFARNVLREWRREPPHEEIGNDPAAASPSFAGVGGADLKILLEECLTKLPPGDADLLVAYVEGDVWRYRSAAQTPGALRVRVHRIRRRLRELLMDQTKKERQNPETAARFKSLEEWE